MRRRLLAILVLAAALAASGCDLDRLPQSPNALSPGAQRMSDTPMGGNETMDHFSDSPPYVAADPL